MLSDRQFSGLSDDMENEGGFTVRAFGPEAGKRGADIYSVGGAVPSHVAPGPLGGPAIKAYATQHREILSQPQMNLGGWQESGSDRALDVSKGFPRTPEGLRGAKWQAMKTDQIAIGELNERGDYVGDIDNPFHVRRDVESRLKAFKAAPEAYLRMMSGATGGITEQIRWAQGR